MHLTATPEWQTLTLKLNYISIAILIYANITATSRILRNKIAKHLKIFVKIKNIKQADPKRRFVVSQHPKRSNCVSSLRLCKRSEMGERPE
jgi:hypothetical protein